MGFRVRKGEVVRLTSDLFLETVDLCDCDLATEVTVWLSESCWCWWCCIAAER